MGEYVESITYRADIDEVKRKLRDLKGSVDDTQSGHNRALGLMDRAWSGLKGTISGAVALAARAGAAIAGGLAVAGGFGLKLAGDFQQTTIAFEGILGSAEKAKSFLSGLRDFAAKTPFEFPGLANAAKNLLAVGFNTENVIPVMTKLGNVAATLGVGETEIQGVVRALGQMKGKGKASAEELQQISEQIPGFSAIKAIAEGLGVSVSEAFDLVAKGAVSADDAIDFILTGMDKFPGAAGAMERQSKTLNGVLSTFKDTLGNLAIDFITPYLPAISSGIESVASWLGSTGAPAFQNFADSAIDAGGRVVAGIRGAGETVAAWWATNGPAITAVVSTVFGAISGWVAEVAPAIRSWVTDVLGELSDWWASNGPTIVTIVSGIAAAIFGLGTIVVRTVQLIVRNWDSIRKPLMVVAGIITAVLIPHWVRLGIAATVSSAKQAAAWVATQAKAATSAAAQVAATYKIIAGWVAQGAAAVKSGAETAAVWLMYQAESAKAAAAHVASAARVVGGWILMGVQATAQAARMAAAWLISMGPAALIVAAVVAVVVAIVKNWDTIVAATKAAWHWVQDAIGSAWGFVQDLIGRGLEFVKNLFLNFTGPGLLIKHWDTIKAGVASVTGWVSDKFEAMISFVTGLPGRIASAAAGMWDGIKNAFRSVINWIIDGWNGLEFSIPGFDPPGPGPKFGGFTLGLPNIPRLHLGGVVPGGPQTEVLRLLQGGETVFTGDQMSELGRVIAGALRSVPTGRGDIGEMNVYPRSSAREFLDEGVWRVAG